MRGARTRRPHNRAGVPTENPGFRSYSEWPELPQNSDLGSVPRVRLFVLIRMR
jgi:hypothetical protein